MEMLISIGKIHRQHLTCVLVYFALDGICQFSMHRLAEDSHEMLFSSNNKKIKISSAGAVALHPHHSLTSSMLYLKIVSQ